MLTVEQQEACLEYLTSDHDEDLDRVISDKVVVGQSKGWCFECGQECKPGTHHRVRNEIYDGSMRTLRFCEDCCAGMAAWMQGDEEPLRKHVQEVERRIEDRWAFENLEGEL
ncbi:MULTISPECIES: hypothetical protein [unclassified Maridesulfovibrio]|uniref:hypothetical protein n=1 Tax=unclassified Maridesulfovibrio TaxID=2794999 RepID=UPI003B3E7A15